MYLAHGLMMRVEFIGYKSGKTFNAQRRKKLKMPVNELVENVVEITLFISSW